MPEDIFQDTWIGKIIYTEIDKKYDLLGLRAALERANHPLDVEVGVNGQIIGHQN